MPFAECNAMSQGYIGFHIQNAIQNELMQRSLKADCISLVSQTVVDENDPAFQDPTKPIGDFMSQHQAESLAKLNNYIVKEDANRGWRRVIASPQPLTMPSINIIQSLLKNRVITIAGGGGGIPVVDHNNTYKPIDAVIDKDLTAMYIASKINADKLIILTAVDAVKVNFQKENEKSLTKIDVKQLQNYIDQNQFAKGSMLPKIIAAKKFVELTNKEAFIGDLNKAKEIINYKSGTLIVKDLKTL